MLAPECVVFFTLDWKVIGHKLFEPSCCRCELKHVSPAHLASIGQNLIPCLARASGVPETYLLGTSVHVASIAARMSWASHRNATRAEDRAYSLMGLFDIHMPMLYGEGDAEFRRLQEQIMRKNDDSSIFCTNGRQFSLMARGPECFANRGSVTNGRIHSAEPYSFTNRGLKLFATARTSQIKFFDELSTAESTVFRIDLGCEVLEHTPTVQLREPMGHDRSMPSGAQYLYLMNTRYGDNYYRLSVAPIHLSQAVLRAKWVDVGEKLLFIVEPLSTELLRYKDMCRIMNFIGGGCILADFFGEQHYCTAKPCLTIDRSG